MEIVMCPECAVRFPITDFGGLELTNGKLLVCTRCKRKFILFEKWRLDNGLENNSR